MGLRPKPHSRTFLPKSPRDPKKPNWIRYIPSSIDSEQGCRRQPCFMFGAHSAAPQPPRCPTCLPFVPHPPFLQRPLCAPRICTVRARIRRPSAPAARSPNPLRTHRPRHPSFARRTHRPSSRRSPAAPCLHPLAHASALCPRLPRPRTRTRLSPNRSFETARL